MFSLFLCFGWWPSRFPFCARGRTGLVWNMGVGVDVCEVILVLMTHVHCRVKHYLWSILSYTKANPITELCYLTFQSFLSVWGKKNNNKTPLQAIFNNSSFFFLFLKKNHKIHNQTVSLRSMMSKIIKIWDLDFRSFIIFF